MSVDLITILGPTASGKTKIGVQLAADFNCEIISADSRQVYKRMDIGTGKDLNEFHSKNIPYHLIDIAEPNEEYNLFRFTNDFYSAFDLIKSRNKMPILVGGTGLYLSAILQTYKLPEVHNYKKNHLDSLSVEELRKILVELKPLQHNVTDLINKERLIQAILVEKSRVNDHKYSPQLHSIIIGIKLSREEIKRRITERLKQRLVQGMVEEVKRLLQEGISEDKLNFFGLEYKFVGQYVQGKLNYNDMFQKLNSAIHSFAKRQMTWFRKMEREGVEINWFSPERYVEINKFIKNRLGDAN